MNGTKYLLDTNYILGLLKRHPVVISELSKLNVATAECSYSAITRMELLGYQGISDKEESIIREKLDYLTYLQINREVEDITINIRKGRKLKGTSINCREQHEYEADGAGETGVYTEYMRISSTAQRSNQGA